jgi:lipopolysaccharide/colanic/teichoic acid biosynthesis glycosyltransferase
MRLWPVILDSQPSYLQGRGRSASLLLAPLGTTVLVEHLASTLTSMTDNAPLVIGGEQSDAQYAGWIRALCPRVQVVTGGDDVADTLGSHELSDALLFVDPRCMPLDQSQLAHLLRRHTAEQRVAHHLVAFERAIAGTKERVCFDPSGHVRGIQRHYDKATWAFIAGVAATIVPCASGVGTDGAAPRSLMQLRELLIGRGVPTCDVPLEGGALDLSEERGMLAANEQLILAAASNRREGDAGAPLYVGNGHSVHATARMMGPIIVHPDASIDENATVLGPAVVGEGARIGAGAVIAHATIGPDCVVPPNTVVRDRAWFKGSAEVAAFGGDRPALSYTERLARLSMEASEKVSARQARARRGAAPSLGFKRPFDLLVSALGLMLLSPFLALIAIAVWVESRGPIFYGDKREGMGGRVFKCWKFRTMYTGAHLAQKDLKSLDHTDGPHFKVDRDPRVTRVGRVLRALNLDEVPQLFNVLAGGMSLVGPRPSPFRENQVCVPWRDARLSVRPGITGFWQVCRHNRSAGDFHQWIEYDLLYVQHQSFWLDLKILAATFLTLGGKVLHVPSSWLVQREPLVEDSPAFVSQAEPQPHKAERVA